MNGINGICLASWSDWNFAAEKVDLKFVTGVLNMDGAAEKKVCRKQTGVSLSTMETEFTSASHVTR